MLDKQQIESSINKLERFWSNRNTRFKDWYEQIRMVDVLAQKNMESFVGNDPRAAYNLIGSILKQKIPHRIPPEMVAPEQMAAAADLSSMISAIWDEVRDSYRLRGRKWDDDLVDFLLTTGWFTVFVSPTSDGSAIAGDIWNPATVYPMWDSQLSQVAHIFQPGEFAIRALVQTNGWTLKSTPSDTTQVRDYWYLELWKNVVLVHNAILIGNELVKEDTIHPSYKRIPIFVEPAGGLPDTGPLLKSKATSKWKEEIGQSFLATNENVYKTTNRWWTFIMQILRDTAQPRTFERTNSAQQLVRPETWNTRGAHYKLGPQDEVGFITPPPIPVELRSTQLDLEAMTQRGGPSWAMFGAVQQRMTAYAMSQIAATTHQVSRPYHQGVIDFYTDADNFLFEMIKRNGYKPYGFALPSELPKRVKLDASYELRVPGDMVQRATTSRMLNPDFELSDEYIMEHNFPEIRNPAEELARVQAGKARKHPIYQAVALITALREDARLLRQAHDDEPAELYEKAANRLEKEIVGSEDEAAAAMAQKMMQAQGGGVVNARPEVSSQAQTNMMEGGPRL